MLLTSLDCGYMLMRQQLFEVQQLHVRVPRSLLKAISDGVVIGVVAAALRWSPWWALIVAVPDAGVDPAGIKPRSAGGESETNDIGGQILSAVFWIWW